MGLLTEKYKSWGKYPEKYTAKQVLDEIITDLEWLDEQIVKNCNTTAVSGSFTAADMERAYDDGYSTEGEVTFDIENYR